jgi:hypothetical protein
VFRAGIASAALFLLFLACPAAMYWMMKGMNKQNLNNDKVNDDRNGQFWNSHATATYSTLQ